MKKVLRVTFFIVFSYFLNSYGQVGKNFPSLVGTTVLDSIIEIPKSTLGKYTLIGMAFSKKSEESLSTWFEPVFQKFIQQKLSKSTFSTFAYDVNVYFVPMFTGLNASATGIAKKKTLTNVDSRLHNFILFYKGDLKAYKESLNFDEKDVPYFFVLDEFGKIIYSCDGNYSEDKMSAIEEVLE